MTRDAFKLFGLVLLTQFPTELALAQEAPFSSRKPVAEADVQAAITDVAELARDLQKNLKGYHDHLKKAMEIYGRGFSFYDQGKCALRDRTCLAGRWRSRDPVPCAGGRQSTRAIRGVNRQRGKTPL